MKRIAATYGIIAAVGCFVPLVDVISYESAALFGVVAGLVSLFWPTQGGDSPLRTWWLQWLKHLGVLAIPVGLLSLNSLRVQNCAPGLGFAFWGLITAVSVGVGTAVRVAVDSLEISPRRRNLITGFVALLSLSVFAWQLAMQPPINGFQLFLGYFSGSIYDEALALPDGLVFYRVWTLALALAVVLWAEVRFRSRNWLATGVCVSLAVVLTVSVIVGWNQRQNFGVDHDRETIAERLGGKIETEHFTIYFPATRQWYDQAAMLAEDHEFRYTQMQGFFGTDPVALRGRKIRSFVYADREQKGAMMGGRRTLVAKLWLAEMHILWREFGDHLLAHELAHIFTEPFGAGPLRLSSRFGVAVNMGLVEGIATAADWPSGDLNVHMAAASLRRLDAAPDIRRLLGASGFWTQSSSRAYTLMGSFIRYLVDTYGIEKFKAAYPHGDFQSAYGMSIDALVAEWETYLDAVDLGPRDLARAKYQYDRPSIFQKICARTVAELRRAAEQHGQMGERDAGIAAWEQILAFDPGNVRYRLAYANFLMSVDALSEANAQIARILKADLTEVERALATELQGDLLWRLGQTQGASMAYAKCLSFGIPNQQRRLLKVKADALKRAPEITQIAFDYLMNPGVDLGAYYPQLWLMRSDDPLGHYLLARRLFGARKYKDALVHLEASISNLDRELLRQEALLLATQSAYFLGQFDASEAFCERVGGQEPYVTEAHEWKQRIAWKRRNRIEGR